MATPIVFDVDAIGKRLRELEQQRRPIPAAPHIPAPPNMPVINTDFTGDCVFRHMLRAEYTLLADPTNATPGTVAQWIIQQDSAGGRKLTYGPLFRFPAGRPPKLDEGQFCLTILTGQFMGGGWLMR